MAKRKIYFFKTSFTRGIGRNEVEVDPADIFNHICGLEYLNIREDINDRYLHIKGDRCSIPYHEEDENLICGKIGNTRLSALPNKEKLGESTHLDLDDDEGLEEITHFIYFKDLNILAIEYNHYGPRINTLRYYLEKKAWGLVDNIDFKMILNNDIFDELADKNELQCLSLKVPNRKMSDVQNAGINFLDEIFNASNFRDTKDVEIILRWDRGTGRSFMGRVKDEIIPGLHRNESCMEAFDKLKIKARSSETNQSKEFDLIKDKLVVEENVIKQDRFRAIDSEDMFNKIKRAYNTKRNILEMYA